MYHTPNSTQSNKTGCIARPGSGRSFPAGMLVKLSISAAILLLGFNCGLCFAEWMYTPEVPYITRQADFILRGRVLEGNKVRIEKQYKGEIESEEISVPGLKKWNDLVQEESSLRVLHDFMQARREAWEEGLAKFKSGGLVGSTVILFLEKGADDNTYCLSGRTLRYNRQFNHAAIKVIIGEKVFGFVQVSNPGPLCLLPLPQDLKTIEEQIAYDRPFLLEFRASCAMGGDQVYNYLSLRFTNLTTGKRNVDFPEAATLVLSIDGETIELPKEFWDLTRSGESDRTLDPGQFINGHYELTNPKDNPPPSLKLEEGTEYKAKITVVVEKDGVEDKYTAETTGKIR